jgi:hypothetical protein
MADIDRRVRILIDTLIDRGYGWLAAEIVYSIEFRRDGSDEIDKGVSSQRMSLNEKIHAGDASSKSSAEDLRASASRISAGREHLVGDGQVEFAVKLLVDRLSSAAEMTSESMEEMTKLMETQVEFAVAVDGDVRPISLQKVRNSAQELRKIEHQLAEWLLSIPPGEEG